MADKEKRTYPDQYLLRMPDGLRDRIKEVAAQNSRSMNQEVITTLEKEYPPVLSDREDALQFLTNLSKSLSMWSDEHLTYVEVDGTEVLFPEEQRISTYNSFKKDNDTVLKGLLDHGDDFTWDAIGGRPDSYIEFMNL